MRVQWGYSEEEEGGGDGGRRGGPPPLIKRGKVMVEWGIQ